MLGIRYTNNSESFIVEYPECTRQELELFVELFGTKKTHNPDCTLEIVEIN